MAYLGVPQPSRAITSADIAQGAVTLNDISFTDVPANMDISGTIDKHTMRLAEGVTVTGDITISDNLILSKISDDGVGITLTNDSSTRTITGSGSIEASTLAQTPNASLTGMTGAVGNGVVFPSGHVIQTQFTQYEGFAHMTGMSSHQNIPLIILDGTAATSLGTTGVIQVAITPKSNSKIKLECQWMGEYNGDVTHDSVWCIVRSKSSTHTRLDNSTSANSSTTNGTRGIQVPFRTYHEAHVGSTPEGMSFTYFDNAHTGDGTDEIIYKLAIVKNATAITDIYTNRCQQTAYYNDEMGISFISATEIAG